MNDGAVGADIVIRAMMISHQGTGGRKQERRAAGENSCPESSVHRQQQTSGKRGRVFCDIAPNSPGRQLYISGLSPWCRGWCDSRDSMPVPTATESMSAKKDNAWDLSPYSMPICVFYVSQSLSPWALTSLKCYYPNFQGCLRLRVEKSLVGGHTSQKWQSWSLNLGLNDFTASALWGYEPLLANICIT